MTDYIGLYKLIDPLVKDPQGKGINCTFILDLRNAQIFLL